MTLDKDVVRFYSEYLSNDKPSYYQYAGEEYSRLPLNPHRSHGVVEANVLRGGRSEVAHWLQTKCSPSIGVASTVVCNDVAQQG